MRELKFRAWDKERNRWFEQDEFRVDGEGEVWFSDHDRPQSWGDWGEQYELMQYTGLKDKNGKEIYEGDIVRATIEESDWDFDWFTVFYDAPQFRLANGGDKNFTVSGWFPGSEYEVIGNRFEHPELLEASHEE